MRARKDILFLCQFFYPEVNSSATLPFDTAKQLVSYGYTVDALCGYPKEYNASGSVPTKDCIEGVGIRRIKYLQMKRTRKIGRLVNYFSFVIGAFFHIFKLRRYKSVIVYSNPPILPLVAAIGNILFDTKLIFVAYDVYPEIAVATQSLSADSLITKGMRRINAKVFKRASKIVALSDDMKSFLLEHRNISSEEDVVVIPNWAHEEGGLPELTEDRDVREAEPFIVSYFGNMGICQDMETLLDAAKLLANRSDILFRLVGHGCKMDAVTQYIEAAGLRNVSVSGLLTGKALEDALRKSAVLVVSLESGLSKYCSPSKYSTYLLAGKPILAIMEEASHIAQEVAAEQCGTAVCNGDAQGLADAILWLKTHPAQAGVMGRNAKKNYEKKYRKDDRMSQYRDAFKSVLEEG